jgi:hypothetical protein
MGKRVQIKNSPMRKYRPMRTPDFRHRREVFLPGLTFLDIALASLDKSDVKGADSHDDVE